MARFVRRIDLPERFAKTSDDYALYSLVAETIGTYYWCETFVIRGSRSNPRQFCILGQRGIVEYAAKKVQQIYQLIHLTAAKKNESMGWQYGVVIALRDTLHARRKEEMLDPLYNDQMMSSIYRARHDLKNSYKVGASDARAVFDIAGFDRGKEYPWDLRKLATPLEAIQITTKDNPERYEHVSED